MEIVPLFCRKMSLDSLSNITMFSDEELEPPIFSVQL
jgi:hypothetical protein